MTLDSKQVITGCVVSIVVLLIVIIGLIIGYNWEYVTKKGQAFLKNARFNYTGDSILENIERLKKHKQVNGENYFIYDDGETQTSVNRGSSEPVYDTTEKIEFRPFNDGVENDSFQQLPMRYDVAENFVPVDDFIQQSIKAP